MKTTPLALAALLAASPAFAQSMSDGDMQGMDHSMHAGESAKVVTADGTLNSWYVDGGEATVNLNHGPIPAINWPPMRMSLKLSDPKLLEGFKPGDKVKFQLKQQSATDFVIVGLEPAGS